MPNGRIAATLEAKGHRLTGSRRAIVQAVLASDDLFSIGDLQRTLPNVGRATIFRTMKLLVDLDLVCRIALEDGSVRYRVSRHSAHHHHIICTACSSAEDFADCDLDAMTAQLAYRTDYDIQGHRLELYGLCPTCRTR